MIPALICVASFCAYVDSVPQNFENQSFRKAMTYEQEVALSRHCEAMNKNGDLVDLLRKIKALAQKSLDLEPGDPARAKEVRAEIENLSAGVNRFLEPEWNQESWTLETRWTVAAPEFMKSANPVMAFEFELVDLKIVGLELAGAKRKDLLPLLSVDLDPKGASIVLKKPATSLELCQLQETLVIEVDYRFKFQNESYQGHGVFRLQPGALWQGSAP